MSTPSQRSAIPILLYNDECGVCRRIGGWVDRSALHGAGDARGVDVRPIGDDPEALRSLSPALDIWDAYATIHLLMPDGSMKLGGGAVAEVLRRIPATRWFAWTFALSLFGFRPFQAVLNQSYAVLDDIRPLFGCESCGTPNVWLRPFVWLVKRAQALFGAPRARGLTGHFALLPPAVLGRRRSDHGS